MRRSDRAYMMRKIVNFYLGPREDRCILSARATALHVRLCPLLKDLGKLRMSESCGASHLCLCLSRRVLLSGLHTVADIHCRGCRALLGWKYLGAFDINHRPKIGRYVLEKGL
jgi:hypothetical protein